MIAALTITVPGQPVPKARARVTRAGHAYTPERTRDYEALVARYAAKAMRGRDLFLGAVSVTILAVMDIPRSWTAKKRLRALSGELQHISRPDADNLGKSFLDAANSTIWKDDAQVVELTVNKRYGEEPRLQVTIEGVE